MMGFKEAYEATLNGNFNGLGLLLLVILSFGAYQTLLLIVELFKDYTKARKTYERTCK